VLKFPLSVPNAVSVNLSWKFVSGDPLFVTVSVTEVRCMQALILELPLAENVSAGHDTHALTLLAPVTPEYVPAGHATHALALLAPDTPEYVPAGHEAHKLSGILVYNAVISSCVNTLLYIRISAICPAYPCEPSALFPIVKSLKFGNVCPVVPVPVALCVPSRYKITDTGLVLDSV
jgi:hypothetical protein